MYVGGFSATATEHRLTALLRSTPRRFSNAVRTRQAGLPRLKPIRTTYPCSYGFWDVLALLPPNPAEGDALKEFPSILTGARGAPRC